MIIFLAMAQRKILLSPGLTAPFLQRSSDLALAMSTDVSVSDNLFVTIGLCCARI